MGKRRPREYGDTKQEVRNRLMDYLTRIWPHTKNCPDDMCHVRALTLPGLPGVREDESLETMILETYPTSHIDAVESECSVYREMEDEVALWHPQDRMRFNLHKSGWERYVQRNWGCYHLTFQDLCGYATESIVQSWRDMIEKGFFVPRGIFAVTLNCSPRKASVHRRTLGGNTPAHIYQALQKMVVKSNRYRSVVQLNSATYRDIIRSRKAQEMMVGIYQFH